VSSNNELITLWQVSKTDPHKYATTIPSTNIINSDDDDDDYEDDEDDKDMTNT